MSPWQRRTGTLALCIVSTVASTTSLGRTCQEMLHKGEPAFFPGDVLRPEQINVRTFGRRIDNKPTVVLLHGLAGSGKTWERLATELSKDYFVIVPDSRGHGETKYQGERFSSS